MTLVLRIIHLYVSAVVVGRRPTESNCRKAVIPGTHGTAQAGGNAPATMALRSTLGAAILAAHLVAPAAAQGCTTDQKLTITEDGEQSTIFVKSAGTHNRGIAVTGGNLTMEHGPRAYLVSDCTGSVTPSTFKTLLWNETRTLSCALLPPLTPPHSPPGLTRLSLSSQIPWTSQKSAAPATPRCTSSPCPTMIRTPAETTVRATSPYTRAAIGAPLSVSGTELRLTLSCSPYCCLLLSAVAWLQTATPISRGVTARRWTSRSD